jgi:hypothetical protein
MTSFGQNYFKDLLNYSDNKTENDTKAIKQNYQLQRRLTDYFANNDKVQLLKSQKFSGEVNLNGDKTPLGGPIDWNLSGIRNVPSNKGCTEEFPFWSFNNKEGNKQKLNKVVTSKPIEEQKKSVENFTNNEKFTVFNQKEHFEWKQDWTWIIITLIVALILFLIFAKFALWF